MQWRWKWCRHCPWMGTQSSPGTLQRGQGDSKANWQMVQHYSVSMSHFHVATAFHEFIFTFIDSNYKEGKEMGIFLVILI